jgi:hypothetical protein
MKLPDLPIIPLFMDHGVRKELDDFMRQIQREAAIWALEEAAKMLWGICGDAQTAAAIRALKEQIE